MLIIKILSDSHTFQKPKIHLQQASNLFIFNIYHTRKHPIFLFSKIVLKVFTQHFPPYILLWKAHFQAQK